MSATRGIAPLVGLTVVSLEQAVSAPMCSRALADLGARVIKLEHPVGGDFARDYDDVVHGMAAHFVWLNRGKESMTLDLKAACARDLLHRLLACADVFVTNLAPGATARLGVDGKSLTGRYPRLIACEITGYGAGGPMSDKRAYDLLIQAEAGVCSITGLPGAPAKPGPPVADVSTGLYAAMSVLAALRSRDQTGRGACIEISLFDTMVELMGYAITWSRYTGVDQEPAGMGAPAVAPYSAYDTNDGQTVVLGTTNDREWQRLAGEMLDRPDLAGDERYLRNADRVSRRAALDAEIGAWCAQRSLAEVQQCADAAGIGNARYNTTTEVIAHPQLGARDRWREIESPSGPVVSLMPPPVIAGYEPAMTAIPGLGEHTDRILVELGLDEAEISHLRNAGAIGPGYVTKRPAYPSPA